MWGVVLSVALWFLDKIISFLLFLRKGIRQPECEERIKTRLELKQKFVKQLAAPDEYGTCGEAIIRDVRRYDNYPNSKETSRRMSSWFKVELKGLYHAGIETFLWPPDYYTYNAKSGKWKRTDSKTDSGSKLGWVIGRIPYDRIVEIDWAGDEHYRVPHVYCRFGGRRKEPYEDIVVYAKIDDGEYLYELGSLERA